MKPRRRLVLDMLLRFKGAGVHTDKRDFEKQGRDDIADGLAEVADEKQRVRESWPEFDNDEEL